MRVVSLFLLEGLRRTGLLPSFTGFLIELACLSGGWYRVLAAFRSSLRTRVEFQSDYCEREREREREKMGPFGPHFPSFFVLGFVFGFIFTEFSFSALDSSTLWF